MLHKDFKTAILIFSKTAAQEAVSKHFDQSAGKSVNQSIAAYFIKKTVHTAQQTGLPVFLHYDTAAAHISFGQRLADAMEAIFKKDFAQIIVIGNDSPELTSATILAAVHQLALGTMVFGPAQDGGVYLIGMSQKQYCRSSFIQLPWQTSVLQAAFQSGMYPLSVGATWLPTLHDIDNIHDFRALLYRLSRNSILKKDLLAILICSPKVANTCTTFIPSTAFSMTAPFRGPPIFS
jgi:uncharacterized protein